LSRLAYVRSDIHVADDDCVWCSACPDDLCRAFDPHAEPTDLADIRSWLLQTVMSTVPVEPSCCLTGPEVLRLLDLIHLERHGARRGSEHLLLLTLFHGGHEHAAARSHPWATAAVEARRRAE
jgi:hypothetical protein